MSLNFSIDSILRHSNVESSNSTLMNAGKLNQAKFLDESTSAFLKKQLNHQQLNNYLASSNGTSTNNSTANGLNTTNIQFNETSPNSTTSLLQSPLFYLNKAANSTAALNLMDNVQTNGSTSNTSLNSSAFAFELNQLSHLNPLELSRLNQLTQFQNQLSQFQSQLVVPYLSKINSLYAETGCSSSGSASLLRSSTGIDCLNSNNGRPNSNQFSNHQHNNSHSNSNHHKSNIENSTSSSKQAAFLNSLTHNNNGTGATLFGINSNYNATGESQSRRSPLSDKSSEMLLNYDDSSDSNRMSQHSGNNVSINSNSSNTNSKHLNSLNSSSNNSSLNNKDAPLCTKCKLHGIRNQVKGHKKNCPKKDCPCHLCMLTDYGKRLRGKKGKKASAAAAANLLSSQAASVASNLPNNLMIDSLNETNNNLTSLNHNLTNLNETALLTGSSSTASGVNPHHQSITPNSNSNSNSSCSNLSMSNALAASLRNHHHHQSTIIPSVPSSANPSTILNQQLSNLHSGLGFLEKPAIKDYMKLVIRLLRQKLAQDGLNYDQEMSRLKFAAIYLLLNRFDKNELFTKFITDA